MARDVCILVHKTKVASNSILPIITHICHEFVHFPIDLLCIFSEGYLAILSIMSRVSVSVSVYNKFLYDVAQHRTLLYDAVKIVPMNYWRCLPSDNFVEYQPSGEGGAR